MVSFLRRMIGGERGTALPIVLALLALGGLTIASSLNYASTSLNAERILDETMKGVYATEAGVEETLWSLENGIAPPLQLLGNINQMEVAIQTEEKGFYTLYLGELIEPGGHSDYLDIYGEVVWDEGAEAYRYTITVAWQPNEGIPVIHLEQVGARLPLGYSYQPGSAADFVDNLSTGEPDETVDTLGAYLLNWELGTPQPAVSQVNPVQTQTFYITGDGELEGDYTWVVANREDIGAVGEIAGAKYQIIATATRPGDGKTAARIVADVMIGEETVYIVSWQISK